MGIYAKADNPLFANTEPKTDETGLLDETELTTTNIFGAQGTPGTATALKDLWQRYFILRENPQPDEMADWIDQMQATAEECEHFVPVLIASNSRNENGEVVFGMNDAAGVFAAWPGTLGIAAAIKGDSLKVADEWAECIRREWDAVGMKKGYMYMADVLTDPRWQRSYGTFGEDQALICQILEHIIPRIQGSKDGVTPDGVAMTTKHFPGGGARENGFDPHYKMGQWNVYATEGSLEAYHLPPFQTAVDLHTASIMPYYAKPCAAKSAPQKDRAGGDMELQPFGFAYNKPFIGKMLREQMGFTGYINSDTGILHNMCWGVEMLDKAERVGFAINYAGTDLISGLQDMDLAKEAHARAYNDYYDTHAIPEGFIKEMITLTDEALDRAVARTLTGLFELGVFEDPYRDPAAAVQAVATPADWANAAEAHRKSVVLLKNDGSLPLPAGKKSLRRSVRQACGSGADLHPGAARDAQGCDAGRRPRRGRLRAADADALLRRILQRNARLFGAGHLRRQARAQRGRRRAPHGGNAPGDNAARRGPHPRDRGGGAQKRRQGGHQRQCHAVLADGQRRALCRRADRRLRYLSERHAGRDAGPLCPHRQTARDAAAQRRSHCRRRKRRLRQPERRARL